MTPQKFKSLTPEIQLAYIENQTDPKLLFDIEKEDGYIHYLVLDEFIVKAKWDFEKPESGSVELVTEKEINVLLDNLLERSACINTASLNELKKLPGIGNTLARRIMKARPFTDKEELLNIEGIRMRRFEQLVLYVRI
jgi:competence protein ComEA